MEILGYGAMGIGGLIFFIGWIWLMITAFKETGALWGILIFFFSWIAGLIYCVMNKTGWIPLAMMIIGAFVLGAGMVPVAMSVAEQMQDAMPK